MILGSRQTAIMQIVWAMTQPVTVKQVFAICCQNGNDIAYTTVTAAMQNLVKHRFLGYNQIRKREFDILISKPAYQAHLVHIVTQRFFDGQHSALVGTMPKYLETINECVPDLQ